MKLSWLALVLLPFISGHTWARGGLSGGGGNVINPVPPGYIQNIYQIQNIILSSRSSLADFLMIKKSELEKGGLPENTVADYQSLFQRQPDVFTRVREVPIHVELAHSCLDLGGKHVDGSIKDDEAGTVCISAHNFAKKVRAQDVFAQALALLVHEYSELSGLDEAGAVNLQRSVLDEMFSH